MTLHLGIPAIVALAGLGLYGFLNGKPSEAGRVMFACGLLATLLALR